MNQQPSNVDLYALLEVEPSASMAEITAAYHSLASKYHPDMGIESSESLRMFKSITAAYEVLSDELARRDYDRQRGRVIPVRVVRPSSVRTSKVPTITFDDLELELPITPEEARYGGPCNITVTFRDLCPACLGTAATNCPRCGGRGFEQTERRLLVQIPRGARTGMVLRIAGRGKRTGANEFGNLLLRLSVRPSW